MMDWEAVAAFGFFVGVILLALFVFKPGLDTEREADELYCASICEAIHDGELGYLSAESLSHNCLHGWVGRPSGGLRYSEFNCCKEQGNWEMCGGVSDYENRKTDCKMAKTSVDYCSYNNCHRLHLV